MQYYTGLPEEWYDGEEVIKAICAGKLINAVVQRENFVKKQEQLLIMDTIQNINLIDYVPTGD